MTDDLHREIKRTAADMKVPVYRIVEAAWKPFHERLLTAAIEARGELVEDPGSLPADFSFAEALFPKPAFSDLSDNERHELQLHLDILRSGDTRSINAVTESIGLFHERVESRRKQPSVMPPRKVGE